MEPPVDDKDEPKNPQKSRKKKKEVRLKNIDVPLNFRPSLYPDYNGKELQITQVLDYSERDFPQLGCKVTIKNKKNRTHVIRPETVASDSANHHRDLDDDRKPSSKKVLKSNKHKEAFKVQIEEIFSTSSNKSMPKHRIKPVKHFKEIISLGGNPLDSDNPIRRKGVTLTKPKVKRMSKTKAMVFNAREEMQRFKKIAERISIKDDRVQADEEVLVDELWKPLCLAKANDVKKCLQNSQILSKDVIEPDDGKGGESCTEDNITNENLGNSKSLEKSSTGSVCSADSQPDKQNQISSLPLEEVLKDSEIPPYKLLIHNNNFKRYCDNWITSELNEITEKLVSQLVRYQYKKYQIDPIKAVANKRYVLGLRQVKKYTRMNKTKLIIFVPNMEESLFEVVEELKTLAVAYCIPHLFAFSRKKLGKLAYKKIGVSCLGILDYSGAEENFKKCIEVLSLAKKIYNDKCTEAKNHYEQHFGSTTITSDISEDICTDFVSKLSLLDGNNDRSNVDDLDLDNST